MCGKTGNPRMCEETHDRRRLQREFGFGRERPSSDRRREIRGWKVLSKKPRARAKESRKHESKVHAPNGMASTYPFGVGVRCGHGGEGVQNSLRLPEGGRELRHPGAHCRLRCPAPLVLV